MLLIPTRRQRRADQEITARRLEADIKLNFIEAFSLLAARRRKKDLPLLSRMGHRRRPNPLTALAAVGLLLILEHRYHFPLLYVGLFDVVGLYHNTMRFDVKKPRFSGGAERKQVWLEAEGGTNEVQLRRIARVRRITVNVDKKECRRVDWKHRPLPQTDVTLQAVVARIVFRHLALESLVLGSFVADPRSIKPFAIGSLNDF